MVFNPNKFIYLLILTLAFSACSRKKSANATQAAEPRPTPVKVSTFKAETREVPAFIEATGSLVADEVSDVAPEVAGQIISTPVDMGAFVAKGAVLARLDPSDARYRLDQARAAERQAQASLAQARERLGLTRTGSFEASTVPEVQAARSSYESAQAQARLAETNARRYSQLLGTGDVAKSVYDQAATQAETARAQANAAKQQLEAAINTARQSNQGIEGARAAVESARSQVNLASKALSDTTIRAPISGFVSDRPVAAGEYVTTQSKIATVMRINPLRLMLQVAETLITTARPGAAVSSTVAAFPGRNFAGRVRAINPALDPASRSLTVEVSIDNVENLLKPGMFATARIVQPGSVHAVFVPRNAIIMDSRTRSGHLFIIEGNTARMRVVQLGDTENDQIRIVNGLNGGELVATTSLDQLYDGAVVQLR